MATTGKQVTLLSKRYRQAKADIRIQVARNISKGTSIDKMDLMNELFRLNPQIEFIYGTDYALISSHDKLMELLDKFEDKDRKILA